MTRLTALTVAALLALPGMAVAAPADAGVAEPERVDAQDPDRADRAAIIRNVERGRPGRRVGVRSEGAYVIVVWEYPGGRVVDIVVDARTGRVVGER